MKVDSRIRQRNLGYCSRTSSSGSRAMCGAGRSSVLSRFMHPHQYVVTIDQCGVNINEAEGDSRSASVERPYLSRQHILARLGRGSARKTKRRTSVATEVRLAKLETGTLNLEGTATAAGGLHLRVVELEAGTFQRLDKVDFGAIEVQQAGLIHEDP